MTAFGSAQADLGDITLALELRSVNSRFLDLHFRLPDELRQAEAPLRELLSNTFKRGKIEVRASYAKTSQPSDASLNPAHLRLIQAQLHSARAVLPDTPAPRLAEILNWPGLRDSDSPDAQAWTGTALAAARLALAQLQQARQREGERLAEMMRDCARQIAAIVDSVEAALPPLLAEHRERLATKLRDTLEAAFPGGFAHISGTELSERLAQEAALFALRIDVAEEMSRLRSHLKELDHLLAQDTSENKGGSVGKRLDFLFQEMNREANTLGSKAGSVAVTRAAMDLKLLIEQLREQAQNLE